MNEHYWVLTTRTDEILDQTLAYLRETIGDEKDFVRVAKLCLGMTAEELKYYCDIEED